MLDQKDDPELDYKCLTDDDWLTCFIKSRDKIVGRIK